MPTTKAPRQTTQDIERKIRQLAKRSFWIGAAMGIFLGLIGGFILGQSSVQQVIVTQVKEGIKV